MTFAILLDFVVTGLLIATILYAIRLNKKLEALYSSRGELQTFLEGFTSSLARAESSMQTLKGQGESTFTAIQDALSKATALRDDLSFLVERGDGIATRLDDSIRLGRQLQKEVDDTIERIHLEKPLEKKPLRAIPEDEPDLIKNIRHIR